jgi:hypothetical protein
MCGDDGPGLSGGVYSGQVSTRVGYGQVGVKKVCLPSAMTSNDQILRACARGHRLPFYESVPRCSRARILASNSGALNGLVT